MRLIDVKTLKAFWLRHRDAEQKLTQWHQTARKAVWRNLQQVRQIYPHADAVEVDSGSTATVFNISGNKYRLITAIHYNRQVIFIMMVLTHAEYATGHWKEIL